MNTLSIYLLESTICLGVFYFFYLAVLHDQPAYQYNRFYLLITSCLSFIFPLLNVPLDILGLGNTQGITASYNGYLLLDAVEAGQAGQKIPFWQNGLALAGMIYGMGLCLTAFFFFKQLYRLYRIIQNGKTESTGQQNYRLIYTHGQLPASSFLQYLFWDNTHPLDFLEQQQILTHEETHIQQKHSYDILYLSLLKIIFWFQPLVYLYEKSILETHEFAADAAVLKRSHPKEYIRLLTKRLFDGMDMSLINHFYKSKTLKRIKMMEAINKKTPWYKFVLIVPVMLSVFFTFSCQPEAEEMSQEVIAETYEEVQAQLQQVGEKLQTITQKYYPKSNEFTNAANKSGNEIAALKAAGANSEDLKKYEDLLAQKDQLHERLMHLPDPDGVYMVVENQPAPQGGYEAFFQHVAKNLRYPAQARRMGIEGKVFIQFTVNEYGELTDIKALKGIGAGCDEEAMRVLESAPEWQPGTTEGKPVKVKMVLPITFKLDHADASKNQSLNSDTEHPELSDGKTLSEMVVVAYVN